MRATFGRGPMAVSKNAHERTTRTHTHVYERTTSNNPLNPHGVGWVNFINFFKVRVSIGTCVPNVGAVRRPCRKKCHSFKFIIGFTLYLVIQWNTSLSVLECVLCVQMLNDSVLPRFS